MLVKMMLFVDLGLTPVHMGASVLGSLGFVYVESEGQGKYRQSQPNKAADTRHGKSDEQQLGAVNHARLPEGQRGWVW